MAPTESVALGLERLRYAPQCLVGFGASRPHSALVLLVPLPGQCGRLCWRAIGAGASRGLHRLGRDELRVVDPCFVHILMYSTFVYNEGIKVTVAWQKRDRIVIDNIDSDVCVGFFLGGGGSRFFCTTSVGQSIRPIGSFGGVLSAHFALIHYLILCYGSGPNLGFM
jgi:hypothetical protein